MVSLYADEGEYARALELAAQLSHDLPGDPAGPQAGPGCSARWASSRRPKPAREVLAMDPQSGQAHLTLAAVAFDRGDHAGAREQLARAERLRPGSSTAALLAAEMALATGEGAEAAVLHLVNKVKNNPLCFADKEASASPSGSRRAAKPRRAEGGGYSETRSPTETKRQRCRVRGLCAESREGGLVRGGGRVTRAGRVRSFLRRSASPKSHMANPPFSWSRDSSSDLTRRRV